MQQTMVASSRTTPDRFQRRGISFLAGGSQSAFTLVELMVSMAVFLLLAGIIFSLTDATGKIWKSTTTKIESFQSARMAFESMTRNISQATLNTYWDYFDANGVLVTAAAEIDHYGRNSELHFVAGPASALISAAANWSQDGPSPAVRPTQAIFFLTPAGYGGASTKKLDRLLNASGYYIEFNSDRPNRPSFLAGNATGVKFRYRLMQLVQPSDRLSIYDPNNAASVGLPGYNQWFNDALAIPPRGADASATRPDSVPIADNIIALIIHPKGNVLQPLSPDYTYDSRNTDNTPNSARKLQRHQLPPFVEVTMVALDEPSAIRLEDGPTPPDLVSPAAVGASGYTGFTDSSRFSSDLEDLEKSLSSKHITYRVFTTNILIKGAKWSEN